MHLPKDLNTFCSGDFSSIKSLSAEYLVGRKRRFSHSNKVVFRAYLKESSKFYKKPFWYRGFFKPIDDNIRALVHDIVIGLQPSISHINSKYLDNFEIGLHCCKEGYSLMLGNAFGGVFYKLPNGGSLDYEFGWRFKCQEPPTYSEIPTSWIKLFECMG